MNRWWVFVFTCSVLLIGLTTAHGVELILIPGGTYLMGSSDGERAEKPEHRVQISGFEIDRYETTNEQFAAFVAATVYITDVEHNGSGWHWDKDRRWHQIPGGDWRHPHGPNTTNTDLNSHPVVQVSWNDARAYCAWAGKRLPTEAEWEYAARAQGATLYAWGDSPPRKGQNYRASYGSDVCCRASAGDGYLYTAPVGSFPSGRTKLGVGDLTGNVWEWVEDAFDPDFYRDAPQQDPVNLAFKDQRVIRGGGWGNNPWGLRATLRHANPPEYGLSMVGFRCARS